MKIQRGLYYTLKSDNPQVPEETLAFQTVAVPIANRDGVLGTLLLGFALDNGLAAQMNQMTDSEITFDADGKVFGATKNLQKMPYSGPGIGAPGIQCLAKRECRLRPSLNGIKWRPLPLYSSPFSVADGANAAITFFCGPWIRPERSRRPFKKPFCF